MNVFRSVLASLVTLFAACCVHAADPATARRVIAILEVETDDPAAYATWLKEYNEIAKAKLNVDDYLRVYQSVFDSREHGFVRVVTGATSVAELMKNAATLENDPAIAQNRDHLRAIRKTGARVLYQAVRSEGPAPKGAHNFNTLAVVNDEPGYLKALDQLRQLLDQNGMNEAKISVYRVLAGRSDHTHRIVVSTGSAEKLAALFDFISTNPQMAEWTAAAAKYRTVVANLTSREITK